MMNEYESLRVLKVKPSVCGIEKLFYVLEYVSPRWVFKGNLGGNSSVLRFKSLHLHLVDVSMMAVD